MEDEWIPAKEVQEIRRAKEEKERPKREEKEFQKMLREQTKSAEREAFLKESISVARERAIKKARQPQPSIFGTIGRFGGALGNALSPPVRQRPMRYVRQKPKQKVRYVKAKGKKKLVRRIVKTYIPKPVQEKRNYPLNLNEAIYGIK